jgi:hypothetical protein
LRYGIIGLFRRYGDAATFCYLSGRGAIT